MYGESVFGSTTAKCVPALAASSDLLWSSDKRVLYAFPLSVHCVSGVLPRWTYQSGSRKGSRRHHFENSQGLK